MRAVLTLLLATLVAIVVIAPAGQSDAKTFIELSPDSGPTASSVQVSGFGFADGEVRIAVTPLGALPPGAFFESLPEADIATLATVAARGGGLEHMVTLPGARDFPWGKQVDILAIQQDPPTSDAEFFVARATFTVTALRDLPAAGSAPPVNGNYPGWLLAALASAGVLSLAAGLCGRILSRRLGAG